MTVKLPSWIPAHPSDERPEDCSDDDSESPDFGAHPLVPLDHASRAEILRHAEWLSRRAVRLEIEATLLRQEAAVRPERVQ